MIKKKLTVVLALILSVTLLFAGGIPASAQGNSLAVGASNQVESRVINVASFNHISVGGNWDVIYVQAPRHSIQVVMPSNWFNRYNFNVVARTLRVERRLLDRLRPWNEPVRPRIYVFAPTLESMNLSGSAVAETRSVIAGGDFVLNITGIATANLNLQTSRNLVVNSSGVSYVNLSGNARSLTINGAGVNRIHAFDLQAREARNVNLAGVGNVELSVIERLDVRIGGTVRLYYRGNPSVSQRIAGSGRVIQVN
jgi:hypothetical protein